MNEPTTRTGPAVTDPDAAYCGSFPRTTRDVLAWQAQRPREAALEPELPIVDAHHHLYGTAADANHYRLDDLANDLGQGHRVVGTVYVEAYASGWRQTGPEAMRPVGEVEQIVGLTATPLALPHGA